MKTIRCGDIVPGCGYVARAESEGELMRKVADHARTAHGLSDVPPEVMQKVKAAIRTE